MGEIAYLGLGTNLGDKVQNLKNAIEVLSNIVGEIISISSIYESEPWGFESTEQFYNIVVSVRTNLSPAKLLNNCKLTELQLGRKTKSSDHYENRIIDVDILCYGDKTIEQEDLIVPHEHLFKRLFVVEPLLEVCDDDNLRKQLNQSLKKLISENRLKKLDNSELL